MYVVIESFSDSRDGYHIYSVGDEFPRSGVMVGKARLEALSTDANAHGRPLIVESNPTKESAEETAEKPVRQRRSKKKPEEE